MSLNIHIYYSGKVTTPNGSVIDFSKKFGCLQTPTRVTDKILAAENKSQVYKDFVNEIERIDEIEIFGDEEDNDPNSDYFFKVVGTEKVDRNKKHCEELDNFIAEGLSLGFEIEYEGY